MTIKLRGRGNKTTVNYLLAISKLPSKILQRLLTITNEE